MMGHHEHIQGSGSSCAALSIWESKFGSSENAKQLWQDTWDASSSSIPRDSPLGSQHASQAPLVLPLPPSMPLGLYLLASSDQILLTLHLALLWLGKSLVMQRTSLLS